MTGARAAAAVALAVSLGFGVAAWTWRTAAVGGSDSACYALMTRAYAAGTRQPLSPLAAVAPWPEATRVAAPGGFLPSSTTVGAAVPVCAPGYSLLVAPLVVVAGAGAVHAVPALAAASVVWLAFLLGRRLATPWAGVASAALVAAHPIVWFQAVQPMNDITTAALWTAAALAAVSGRPVATGLVVGVGLLVRPNLAPAAVVAVLVAAAFGGRAPGRPGLRPLARSIVVSTLAAAPALVAVAALNASLYGSPLRSGYGDLDQLFAWSHLPTNLARYGRTWIGTSTPIVLAALAAPWLLMRERRAAAAALAALAVALSAVYLVYLPFPEWWYLRYLLPAVVLSLVLAASTLVSLGARLAGVAGVAVAVVAAFATAVWMLRTPESAEARGLQRLEARFAATAAAVAAQVAPSAVAITGWDSGAIRFGPGQEVVMWDALDPAWLDRAIAWLEAQGRPVVLVLEGWEEAPFRARFAGQDHGALDWPPRLDIARRVRLYVPGDRAAFRRGEPVPTAIWGSGATR